LSPGDPEANSEAMSDAFERDVQALARRIADAGGSERPRLFHLGRWAERVLDWALAHPRFKTQLFHFVDVFPACRDDADVLRHIEEYFADVEVPRAFALGLGVAEHLPFGAAISAAAARRNIVRMARQLIAGTTPEAALPQLERLWRAGEAATVDLLGERTLSEADAARYATRVAATLEALVRAARTWPKRPHLERDPWGVTPRANVSVKPTALSPRFGPLTAADGLAEARERLLPILRRAREVDATIHLDSEHDEVKDLTFELLRTLGEEFPDGPQLGAVVQAYRKDAFADLRELITWSARTLRRPLVIRLVKGAYWDFETVIARAQGWPMPVFELKAATDANYERCVRYLVEQAGAVRPACGSHNLRSIACAIAAARARGLPDTALEHQLLYGMAEPVHAALCRLGLRVRVYAPVGDLVTGMAYLVRRLLENTSNESFIRHRFAEGRELEALIAPPALDASELPGPEEASRRIPTDPAAPAPFANESHVELRRPAARERLAAAVAAAPAAFGFEAQVLIEGAPVATAEHLVSIDPGDVATVVCRSGQAGRAEADQAIEAARRAWPAWQSAPWRDRAAVLFGAAAIMRRRRDELAALEVFEAGKPQAEADADVCEAIDFCEYYGREAVRLGAGVPLCPTAGETTVYRYRPRGIGAVIAPWNFPLAIPAGMVGAALVTGNCVLFKPAEQTPGIALRLVEILLEAGAPPGALAFLPGVGEEVGAYVVDHPDVAFIAFTGSRPVGLTLVERAARQRSGQRHVKRVVAEMGGKNAIVVDSDADLDQAVPGIVTSAFAYAGQKCSAAARVIALAPILDELVERVVGAAAVVPVGHARELRTVVGPLIDEDAWKRVRSYQEIAAEEGEVVYRRETLPAGGWYVGPTVVVTADAHARIAREEIFGPLLTVLRADDFEHALALANDTEYALTGGLYSRSPARIRHAAERFRAGNFYINRPITGALVGRHPFGGHGLSGVGSKAGGPDYLLQFVEPRVVTENTLRRGYAGEE
jgi:RHH-type transcriptional regulator, proline utilization regulon repressor / proline dehydrogenase / delta 1-pyrroline-5-carboxylate dehydrogenase